MTEARSNPVLPNFMSPDISGMGKKNFEALAAVQKEILDALNKANQAWVACLNEEATLTSNFTKRVTTAGTIPEAAAAYQEWASQQMELFSRQSKRALEEAQGFTTACTKLMSDGGVPASS